MHPATSWHSDGRAWSVEGRLRSRRDGFRAHRKEAGKRQGRLEARRRAGASASPLSPEQQSKDEATIAALGEWIVLAFLFAQPFSMAMRHLDESGEYFDVRSGDHWDLFLPGYYKSDPETISGWNAKPVGQRFTSDWQFSAEDFNLFRGHIEKASNRRWQYSGDTDLVLLNAYIPYAVDVDVEVDWESIKSGQLTDTEAGVHSLSLGAVIERITADLRHDDQDDAYGVSRVVTPYVPDKRPGPTREFVVSVIGEIAANLAAKGVGLG